MSGGNDKLERELDSFLADDSRVAALYRKLPKDEPDAKLDAAILAQARAAVAPRRRRPRWLPAMSAAAAIVIAAGLAYRVGPHVWNERSAVSAKAEQRVAAPASVPQQAPKDAAPQTPPANTPQPEASKSAPSAVETQVVTGNAIRRLEIETARPAEADKLQSQKRKAEEQKPASDTVAKQAAQGRLQRERARDDAVSNAQPALQLKSTTSPPRLDAAPAPPVAASPATPAVLAEPAAKPNAPEPNAFPSPAAGAYAPAAPAPSAARAPVRESAQSVLDVEANLYPEHWVADMQQMLKDGRRDDAIKNLKAFRKHYPDYTLPDDLRDLK